MEPAELRDRVRAAVEGGLELLLATREADPRRGFLARLLVSRSPTAADEDLLDPPSSQPDKRVRPRRPAGASGQTVPSRSAAHRGVRSSTRRPPEQRDAIAYRSQGVGRETQIHQAVAAQVRAKVVSTSASRAGEPWAFLSSRRSTRPAHVCRSATTREKRVWRSSMITQQSSGASARCARGDGASRLASQPEPPRHAGRDACLDRSTGGDDPAGLHQDRDELARLVHAHLVVPTNAMQGRPRDPVGHLELTSSGDEMVLHGGNHCRRDVHAADP